MKKVWINFVLILAFVIAASIIYTKFFPFVHSKEVKPNIILILGDDIGYSDIQPFGSEIQTPNLQKLTEEGIMFSNFYNMSKCEPSRSALFTGLYEGGKNAVNFAQILKNEGYYVIHSGKEHWMKWAPEHLYAKNVFDQSLTFEATSEFFIPPEGKSINPFFLNGELIEMKDIYHEKEPFYLTDVITDNALKWIKDPIEQEQPFFLYLGYNAAHFPLQALPEDIAKYRGKYMKGWDKIREERMERILARNLLPDGTVLSPPSSNINKFRGHPDGNEEIRKLIPLYRPWESLNETEKDELDLEMSVFAAMVDRMDQNIGRVLNFIQEKGLADNTIVIYLSDNGSCPYDSNRDFEYPPGVAEGFRTLSAAWANAGNTPFKYFKQYGHEGGAHTHFILRWPSEVTAGQLTHQIGHIADVAPTLLDATNIEYPEEINGLKPQSLQGRSLLPVLKGDSLPDADFYLSGWTDRFRMYRQNDWKIVKLNDGPWELYNMQVDPTEINDLSAEKPGLVEEMEKSYLKTKAELIPADRK